MDRLSRIAERVVRAGLFHKGDLCVVDMREAERRMGDNYFGLKFLKEAVARGGRVVVVDENYGNPPGKFVGVLAEGDAPGETVIPAPAKSLSKVASRIAASVQEGDVCVVDMAVAKSVWPQQFKIIKDVVRQGGGKVVVEEVRGDTAQVSAHENPMSRLVGMVDVPLKALRKVG